MCPLSALLFLKWRPHSGQFTGLLVTTVLVSSCCCTNGTGSLASCEWMNEWMNEWASEWLTLGLADDVAWGGGGGGGIEGGAWAGGAPGGPGICNQWKGKNRGRERELDRMREEGGWRLLDDWCSRALGDQSWREEEEEGWDNGEVPCVEDYNWVDVGLASLKVK